jgi:hypothetical protein
MKLVVEIKEFARVAEEIYPADPNPSTDDLRFDVIAGLNAVEKEEKD